MLRRLFKTKKYHKRHKRKKKLHLPELGFVIAYSVHPVLNSWPFSMLLRLFIRSVLPTYGSEARLVTLCELALVLQRTYRFVVKTPNSKAPNS